MKTSPIVPASIRFAVDGPAQSLTFDDVYHPQDGPAEQAASVFLDGNGLPGRWHGRDRFTILETGFGLGNNFLATWAAWRNDTRRCERLHVVSIDVHPPTSEDLRRAHTNSPWPDLAESLRAQWPPLTANLHALSFDNDRVQLLLAFGDVRTLLPQLSLVTDALYLDGFAPARNPAMWEPRMFKALARRSLTGTTAATWSSAGAVRRGLMAAGFDVTKVAGPGRKREVTHAVWRAREGHRTLAGRHACTAANTDSHAVVIGAGLAGAWTARELTSQGWRVTVLEQLEHAASGASGNPGGIYHGVVHAEDGIHARLFRAAALHAHRRLHPLVSAGLVPGEVGGLLRLTPGDDAFAEMVRIVKRQGLPANWVTPLDRADASRLAGTMLPDAAWFYPGAGWVSPALLVRHLLQHPDIQLLTQRDAAALRPHADGWHVLDHQGQPLASASVVVLAAAGACQSLAAPHAEANWPLTSRRAQISCMPGVAGSSGGHGLPRVPIAGGGYVIRTHQGELLFGGGASSLDVFANHADVTGADHLANLTRLQAMVGLQTDPDPSRWTGRAGWRLQTPDRLPLVGPLALQLASMPPRTRLDQPRMLPRVRGLYVHTALGSRGITLAPLCGALLAARIAGAPLPLEQDLQDALDPGRFLVRAVRRGAGHLEQAD